MKAKQLAVLAQILAIYFVLCNAGGATGQIVRTWKDGVGAWSGPANWDPFGIPGANDYVYVSNGGMIQISSFGASAYSVYLGYPDGSGTLKIQAGGILTYKDFLSIGSEGTGTMLVENGGDVMMSANSTVPGGVSVSDGTLTVDGPGSTLTNTKDNSGFSVGQTANGSSTGTALIRNGGLVLTGNASINAKGTVTVDGLGSRLTVVDQMNVQGQLRIQNGGTVTSENAHIRNSVIIDGVGATLTTTRIPEPNPVASLYVYGELAIRNGGTVSAASGTRVNGVLNLQSGTLTTAKLNVSNSLGAFDAGIVNLDGGTLIGDVVVEPEGSFNFESGTLSIDDFFVGNLVNQGGTLKPSGHAFNIAGNYTQTANASLEALLDPVVSRPITVLSDATIGGKLRVNLANNSSIQPNRTFTILDAGSNIAGAFTNVANGEPLEVGGYFLIVHYGPESLFARDKVVLTLEQSRWIGFDGIFSDAPEWEDNEVPEAYDYALFDQAANYTVTATSPIQVQKTTVRNGSVRFDCSTYVYKNINADIEQNGTLTVTDGSFEVTKAMTVGTNSAGTLQIEGFGHVLVGEATIGSYWTQPTSTTQGRSPDRG